MSFAKDILFSPFRVLKGAWGGFCDGFSGDRDTREKFGFFTRGTEGNPSRAGRLLNDFAGTINGSKWGGRLFAGAGVAVGAAFGVFTLAMATSVGMYVLGGAMLLVAPLMLGALAEKVGPFFGGLAGGVIGAVLGPVVGAFNALFKRGYYKETKPDMQAPPPAGVTAPPPLESSAPSQMQSSSVGQAPAAPAQRASQAAMPAAQSLQASGVALAAPVLPEATMLAQEGGKWVDAVSQRRAVSGDIAPARP